MKKLSLLLLLSLILISVLPAETVFRVNNTSEPGSLDPALATSYVEERIILSLFDGLFTYDPETGDAIPSLCDSWQMSDDGLTYTYHLREARWSDGTEITADDVVYSWFRALDPETASPQAVAIYLYVKGAEDYYNGIADISEVGIRKLDSHTIEVVLKEPASYFNDLLVSFAYLVVPRHAIEKYGSAWILPENIVTSGAFTLSEWRPQDRIVLTRNKYFWDNENVGLDKVIYYPIEDTSTAYNMYRNDELDWDIGIPSDLARSVMMRRDYQSGLSFSNVYYIFNLAKRPFDDVNVRKAFFYAIDNETITDTILNGVNYPSYGLVPDVPGYDIIDESEGVTYDPELAREYLAAAGYPNGRGFPRVEILFSNGELNSSIGAIVQRQLKENLGITVTLAGEEHASYISDMLSGQFTITFSLMYGGFYDPISFLIGFNEGDPMNIGNYHNAKYDELLRKAGSLVDEAERFKVLREAEDVLIKEDAAIVPLYYGASQNLIDTRKWGGWYTNILDIHPLRFVYLRQL